MNSAALPRLTLIDWLRTLAILLMFIYHFAFDLQNFHLIEYATFNGIIMTAIGRTCLSLFMFCVGYSLAMSHYPKLQWRKFWPRWFKIAGAAALVSLATYLSYPEYWIFFGILHCIAFVSLILLPFLRFPHIAIIIGITMLVTYAGFHIPLPFFGQHRPSLDYIPPYPWSWSAFVGIGAFHYRLHEKIHLPRKSWIEIPSRHSLLIYLIHQPILMGIAYFLWRIHPQ